MATQQFTDGVTLTAASWFNDVDTVAYAGLTAVAGTNTITATGPTSMTAYAANQAFKVIPAATNTGATTINLTCNSISLGAKNIFFGGVALGGGELKIGVPAFIAYDGTQFNLLTPFITTTPSYFRRNRLKNASFQVDQRGNSATSRANDVYGIDCWYTLTQTAAIQITQQTLQENGQPYNIRLTQNQAAAQRMGVAQIVEARDSQQDRAKAMTLSARIRCSSSQAIRYAILEWTGTADAVTSDVVSNWASGTYTAGNFFLAANLTVTAVGSITPSAAAWTTITQLTGVLGSSVNNQIVFIWTEGTAAQNVTLDVGVVQLEPGGLATPFDFRTFEQDDMDANRYLPGFFCTTITTRGVIGIGHAVNGTTGQANIPFRVRARIPPTAIVISAASDFAFTDGGGTGIACTALAITYASEYMGNVQPQVAAGLTVGAGGTLYGITAGTSRLVFTGAEL